MTTLLLFLLVMFLLFRGIPWLLTWWLRRKQRQYQEQVGEAFERAAREQREQEREQHRHEYVERYSEDAEFVEISGPREEVIAETFTAEEQVIDAEFEDI
ncbi:MAG: hypothetical protein IKS64_00515 [Muribaculaceae bacterium]|nr:hypothetical protein [Muribaculaceae bacterium]MBR6431318.1 hypothetical protein [Muribaculaceae bacterium]